MLLQHFGGYWVVDAPEIQTRMWAGESLQVTTVAMRSRERPTPEAKTNLIFVGSRARKMRMSATAFAVLFTTVTTLA